MNINTYLFISTRDKTRQMSIPTDEQFNISAFVVKSLKTTPDNNELLELYALYKQATCGDCDVEKPGSLNFKQKSKWNAWNSVKGLSSQKAKQLYIKLVEGLVCKYN
jgi:diazepam-binding inhibitor (GABA receptor modulating acyl-CoA-binding protein)